MTLRPRQPVPNLDLPLVGGGRFSLTGEKPDTFSMLVFYRGLHCPICKTYLADLDAKIGAFKDNGVKAVAVTSETQDRVEQTKKEWALQNLPLAYAMPIALGREWGLSVSNGISDKEPKQFLEPGLFLVRPDLTLYAASVQTMPFARPSFADVLAAVKFVVKNNYPARGEA
jgi:peroxiredoxin